MLDEKLLDTDGRVIGVLSMAQEITERKRAEEALRTSEERLAADLAAMTRLQEVSTRLVPAADSTPLLLEIVDAAIAITSADMGNIQLLDRESGELKIVASRGFEAPFLEYFGSVEAGKAACGTAARQASRVVVEDVATSPVFEGTPAREVVLAADVRAVQSTPLVSRSGRLVGMLSTHYRSPRLPSERDLSVLDLLARQAADWIERTKAEEALLESEARFRTLAESGPSLVWTCTSEWQCDYVNPRFSHYTGLPETSLLGAWRTDLIHPDDHAEMLAAWERSMTEDVPVEFEIRLRRHDGAWRWFHVAAAPLRDAHGQIIRWLGTNTDIDDRKRAEDALRASEERYRSLISQVKDFAIFATDERRYVSSWNEGCQHILGYTQEQFLGLHISELYLPDDRDAGIPAAEFDSGARLGTVTHARWMTGKGGRRFFAMGATAARRDAAGTLLGFSTVVRDLTQMKLSQDQLAEHGESLRRLISERTDQLERTTERLRVSEHLASLGTLAAGLGHDMGNLILPLEVRLELLLEADLAAELREHVVGIQKCVHYLKRFSTGLRMLANDPRPRTAERTELNAWWNEIGLILEDILPSGIRLQHELPDAPCWVAIGRVGVTQAVLNLVQNAVDAMKERGTGRIGISVQDDPDAGAVWLRVQDEGAGMSDEVIRHCMEPYFSTKERGEWTGMGLAFVHGLVTGAGGRVELASAIGRGTTVSLVLPRALPGRSIPERVGAA